MSAPESYQLESLLSEVDAGKPPSPTASIDPSKVRWLENQRSRGWEVCKIVTRAVATFLCLVTLILCMAWYSWPQNSERYYSVWIGLTLLGVLPAFLWDLAEFLTLCARHGRGVTPKALIGVEVVITVICGFAAGWLGFQLGVQGDDVATNPLSMALTAAMFTGITAVIHFFLFVRACIERRREIRRRRPRVMYIPETGQTVYVVARAFPKLPTLRSQRTQSFPRSTQSPTSGKESHPLRNEGPKSPDQLFHTHIYDDDETPPPLPDRPTGQAAIRRKPIPGLPPNIAPGDLERHMRPSMRPPPDDYEPDEAELERMRRGDAQPQLIQPGDVDLKFATSATGMTPADADSREGKFRMNIPLIPGESSSGSSRRG
ncbi:hypothetical protein Cob_v005457 [Colletotrichum orbiculare MAFF 240422]|uniref:Uncharacterized protein n=1 Tax=Colletotrichum orbiculare (strain 104-T / ATCC 96160 / CBS 514.97 / LARS 414 / MAFF 240422) TaxID=1213857 RepID=N4VN43_COLOR|nr:hypothetical protein Cob_v005457 [Colletotrichum orbiculare MAFF 240422]